MKDNMATEHYLFLSKNTTQAFYAGTIIFTPYENSSQQ
jgi:hypothetical protein